MSATDLRKKVPHNTSQQLPAQRRNTSKSPALETKMRSISSSRKLNLIGEQPSSSSPYKPTMPDTRSKSPTRQRETTSSTNKSTNKFDSEMTSILQTLTQSRHKLCSCMQIYSMLESSGQSQRCLQHNNTLSLYCLNQRRILCVNCLYGMHRHRSHKVVPLKDCMEEVHEDNRKLKGIIEEEIKRMDYYGSMAEENAVIVETEMRKVIAEMQGQYLRKIEQIKQKYEHSKQQILQNFTPVIQKSRAVKAALQDFRFNVWKSYTLHMDQKSTDQNQIMKQLLFVTIVELCEFRNRGITRSQLEGMSRRLKTHF